MFSVRFPTPSLVRSTRGGAWWRLAGVCGLAVALSVGRLGAAGGEPVPGEARDFEKPLEVGATEIFFPYSFRDQNGRLTGFAVDVADAVAAELRVKFHRRILVNTAIAPALRAGEIDVAQFWSETDERRQWAEFSTPIVIAESIVLRRKGDERIRRPEDLAGRRVAVGQKGTVGDRYVHARHPTAQPVYTETTEEFLRMLDAGDCDAAVLSRLTALSMIDRFKLRNLEVLDAKLPGYEVRYCFAVRKGDSLLLARLNEALATIRTTGNRTFDRIYEKWFGPYEGRRISDSKIATFVALALAVVCAVAGWGFFRQRSLRRRIARQAEELAEQRSLLAALHEKHPVATLVLEAPVGRPARLVSLNPEARRLLSLDDRGRVAGELGALPLPADWRQYLLEVEARWNTTPHADQWESRLPGHDLLLESSLVPLGAGTDGVPRFCVLVADVTRRRMMDQEIAQSRRLRALGELVGGIAHEFNNLLTPIIATTNLVQAERKDDAQLQSDLGMVEEAAKRAAELTRRLLTFGRKSDERAQPVLLADAVHTCFSLLRPTIDRRIEWHNDVSRELGPVFFNPTDLHQIIFNLVLNARDTLLEKLARHPGATWTPRISLSAAELAPGARAVPVRRTGRRFAAWQCVIVEDNGLGIPPEHLERIFEPFFTTKDVGKGTGLGLATIWHLVNDAGGDITVDSTPGEGTRFFLYLPRWECGVDDLGTAAEKPAQPAQVPARRVLLVEDDPLVARVAVAVYERLGHAVTHLLDGVEAWSHLSNGPVTYDLLLLDVNMPRMNGVDLVRRLREAKVPGRIVITSGRLPESDAQALRELGVDEVLIKPFTPAQLAELVTKQAGVPTATV